MRGGLSGWQERGTRRGARWASCVIQIIISVTYIPFFNLILIRRITGFSLGKYLNLPFPKSRSGFRQWPRPKPPGRFTPASSRSRREPTNAGTGSPPQNPAPAAAGPQSHGGYRRKGAVPSPTARFAPAGISGSVAARMPAATTAAPKASAPAHRLPGGRARRCYALLCRPKHFPAFPPTSLEPFRVQHHCLNFAGPAGHFIHLWRGPKNVAPRQHHGHI